jgi:hypothetical protein
MPVPLQPVDDLGVAAAAEAVQHDGHLVAVADRQAAVPAIIVDRAQGHAGGAVAAEGVNHGQHGGVEAFRVAWCSGCVEAHIALLHSHTSVISRPFMDFVITSALIECAGRCL